jgi:hypothetical protein
LTSWLKKQDLSNNNNLIEERVMKFKILLTGNSGSCGAFLKSLSQHLGIKLTPTVSSCAIGVVRYMFEYGEDEIELNYIEELDNIQPNYKAYGTGAHGIVFTDAKKETIEKLQSACQKSVQVVKHKDYGDVDGAAGMKLVVGMCHAELLKVTDNRNSTFQPACKTQPARVPTPPRADAALLDELKAVILRKSSGL